MDLARVCVTATLLTSDKDTLVFLLLGFENKSFEYWNLPLENSIVLALGMNQNNSGLKPDVEWSRVSKYLEMSLLKA